MRLIVRFPMVMAWDEVIGVVAHLTLRLATVIGGVKVSRMGGLHR